MSRGSRRQQPIIAVAPIYTANRLNTTQCIDTSHSRVTSAPIVEYNSESAILRRYIVPSPFDSKLANYILLGQISVAESYFRAIIRRIILIDSRSHLAVANNKLTYAAAHYLPKDMMPESLLDGISLASSFNLKEVMKDMIDIKGGFAEIEEPLSDFSKLCQLRHCIVHRFSYLGSNNAAVLGIESHNSMIEKPIVFNYSLLQDAFQVVDVAVRSVNNFLFTRLVHRLADEDYWSWAYSSDWRKFDKYYSIFVDKTELGGLSRRDAYTALEQAKK